jgi:two-component system sensor histidine kinase QseC
VTEIDWPAIVEQAMSDSLSLAERRRVELECEWPPEGLHPLPLLGDPNLLTVLLRNLLDNAVRYAPAGSTVTLRFDQERLDVENEGPTLTPEQLASLGERFHRFEGQAETGSGLGISIVRRIATLHGLEVDYAARADGSGVRATVRFAGVGVADRATAAAA